MTLPTGQDQVLPAMDAPGPVEHRVASGDSEVGDPDPANKLRLVLLV